MIKNWVMTSVINFNKIKYLYIYSHLIFNTKIYVYKSLQGSLIKNSQSNLYLKTSIHPLRSWKKKRKKRRHKDGKKRRGEKERKIEREEEEKKQRKRHVVGPGSAQPMHLGRSSPFQKKLKKKIFFNICNFPVCIVLRCFV